MAAAGAGGAQSARRISPRRRRSRVCWRRCSPARRAPHPSSFRRGRWTRCTPSRRGRSSRRAAERFEPAPPRRFVCPANAWPGSRPAANGGSRARSSPRSRGSRVQALFAGRPDAVADIVERAERMSSSPIATVNLWFDRPVLDEPFVGLPGRVMQWVFDKRTVFGDAAVAPLAGVERRRRDRPPAQRPADRDGARRASGGVSAGRAALVSCARQSCASGTRRFRWRPVSLPAHRRRPPSAASFWPAIGLIPACPRPSRARSAPVTEPRPRRSASSGYPGE